MEHKAALLFQILTFKDSEGDWGHLQQSPRQVRRHVHSHTQKTPGMIWNRSRHPDLSVPNPNDHLHCVTNTLITTLSVILTTTVSNLHFKYTDYHRKMTKLQQSYTNKTCLSQKADSWLGRTTMRKKDNAFSCLYSAFMQPISESTSEMIDQIFLSVITHFGNRTR